MIEGSNKPEDARSVVSNRAMNIVVALALMTVSVVVMIASHRLGAGWEPHVGPGSGYFPFYIALFMFVSSTVTLLQQLFLRRSDNGGSFIAYHQMIMVLQVVVPMTIFVVLSIYIGIYISTTLFIGFFMTWHGRYPLYKTIPVAIGVPIVLFLVFEMWFLVPLPKGPFEAWLGY
ncbi:MAG: tripartite tricarboxylate transporter TctB family protein [Rhodomicrobiaceae bacterium]